MPSYDNLAINQMQHANGCDRDEHLRLLSRIAILEAELHAYRSETPIFDEEIPVDEDNTHAMKIKLAHESNNRLMAALLAENRAKAVHYNVLRKKLRELEAAAP